MKYIKAAIFIICIYVNIILAQILVAWITSKIMLTGIISTLPIYGLMKASLYLLVGSIFMLLLF